MAQIIGYLRQAKHEKDQQPQLDQLNAAGASRIIRQPYIAGKPDQAHLEEEIAALTAGDSLLVTGLDQIACNTRQLLQVVESLSARGISFKVLDLDLDTAAPSGALLSRLLAAITSLDRQLARQRQAEGIERAKQAGRYKGRLPTAMAKAEQALALNAQGLTRQKIAEQLGIGVASVYRILKKHAPVKAKVSKVKKAAKPPAKKPQVEGKAKSSPATEQLSLF